MQTETRTLPDPRVARYRLARRWAFLVALGAALIILVVLWVRARPWGSRFVNPASTLGALSSLSALVGTVLLTAAILLSARWRLVEAATGGLDREYRLHHWVGGAAFAMLALHPILLAWRYAQVSWDRAAGLWWPGNAPVEVLAGQTTLYLMALAMFVTLFVPVRHQLLLWTQRLLGALYLPAAYHVLYTGGDASADVALRRFLQVIVLLGLAALILHTVLGRIVSRHYRFVVSGLSMLPGEVTDLRLRPCGRPMPFMPGQFGYLRFTHQSIGGEAHPFSMASATSTPELRFAIKDLGDYTHRIGDVELGAEAMVEGPYGRFSHRLAGGRRQVWVAGGIGIAPFLAMAQSLRDDRYDVDLFYGYPEDAAAPFLDELGACAASMPWLRVHPVCEADCGFVTADLIARTIGSFTGREFLLCGPIAMMHALEHQLRQSGVRRRRIHFEELAYR